MRVCPGCRSVYKEDRNVCPKDGLPLIERSPTFAVVKDGKAEPPPRDSETAIRAGLMIGEYKVEKALAEGGMGVIYAGVHPLISKRVAIKVLNKRFAEDPKAVSRFVLEARSVNEIGHHNIVDIFSIGELDDGRNYLIMELLDGLPLHEILHVVSRLKPGEVLPIYEQLADALASAHAKGFVHRDIKPDNVVVLRRPPHPFIKILDFGLAKLRSSAQSSNTEVGTVLGTPEYMAPEQCRGKPVDPRTDIYAMGVMMYELLTGRRPFTDPSPLRVLAMQQREPPQPPSKLTPIPEGVEWVILKAMAKDPDQRFANVQDLLSHLTRVTPQRLPWGPLLADCQQRRQRRMSEIPQVPLPIQQQQQQQAAVPAPYEVQALAPEEIQIPDPVSISGELDDESETLVADDESKPPTKAPDSVLQKIRLSLPDQDQSQAEDKGPAMPTVRNVRLGPAEARAPAPLLGTPESGEIDDLAEETEVSEPPDEAEMMEMLAAAQEQVEAKPKPAAPAQPPTPKAQPLAEKPTELNYPPALETKPEPAKAKPAEKQPAGSGAEKPEAPPQVVRKQTESFAPGQRKEKQAAPRAAPKPAPDKPVRAAPASTSTPQPPAKTPTRPPAAPPPKPPLGKQNAQKPVVNKQETGAKPPLPTLKPPPPAAAPARKAPTPQKPPAQKPPPKMPAKPAAAPAPPTASPALKGTAPSTPAKKEEEKKQKVAPATPAKGKDEQQKNKKKKEEVGEVLIDLFKDVEQPRPESAEMLVDVPPDELRGPGTSNVEEPLPDSGVYAVESIVPEPRKSSPAAGLPAVSLPASSLASATSPEQKESPSTKTEALGTAKTMPLMELSDEERAKLPTLPRKEEPSPPEQPAAAAQPDAPAAPERQVTSPGEIVLSTHFAQTQKTTWYTSTWFIALMAVMALAAIVGTVVLLTQSS